MNIFEVVKKILKAQSPEEIDAITENLDKQTLKDVINLLVERLTPVNIKINRIINSLTEEEINRVKAILNSK